MSAISVIDFGTLHRKYHNSFNGAPCFAAVTDKNLYKKGSWHPKTLTPYGTHRV